MRVRPTTLTILLLSLASTLANAQHVLETHVNEPMAYTIDVPSGWVTYVSPEHEYLNAQPPEGSPEHGLVAIELAIEPSFPGTLEQGIEEVLDGFRSSVPDLQVASRSATSITGIPAAIVDIRGTIQGQRVAYRLVFVLYEQRGYVLFLETLETHLASYAPLFDQVLTSFTLTGVATPPPTPPLPSETSFAGVFVGDQMTLALEAALPGVHYVGTLQHGEARYPVTAQATTQGLAGTFESAGHRFDFSATLERDVLTFVTGGTSFVLTRHGAAPEPDACNPLVPSSCERSTPTPPGPATVEAPFTHEGTVGALPLGGSARGSLAGAADALPYHTYVIDVPAGASRLVLELEADAPLGLAAKFGSDIRSYAARDQGGDWDEFDTSDSRHKTVVIQAPRAGRWYVDVVNWLGPGHTPMYHLTAHAPPTGSAPPPTPAPTPVASEVPDTCLLLPLMPAAATAGPPPVIELGTRLVYYAAAASIPGERGQLVQDDNGHWINRETGQRYSEHEIPGAGGASFEVLHVGYLDERTVQLTQRSYRIDGATGRTVYTAEAGTVSHAGCAGDFWVHPHVLAALPDMDQDGTRVLRMPYQLGELVFDAIRIHTTTTAGFTAYVYDLDSGLLLYFGSHTVGPDILTPYSSEVSGPGRGSTQLTNGWIRDIQQVDVPWRDAPTPEWVTQVREIDYEGTLTVVVPGSPTFPLPVHQHVQVAHRGRDWLQVRTDSLLYSFEQQPVGIEHHVTSHGPASIGGLWIAPQALARLTPGQRIDQCGITGYTTSVAATSADVVTITEAGPLHRNDFVYDTRTGLLASTTRVQHLGESQHVLELRLVGGPR